MEYEERLKILELPTLAYRRERADMIEAYKITHGVYDIELAPKLQMASARHLDRELRGHNYKLLKPRARRSARANAFTVRMWNSLPEEVVQAPSLNAFKAKLDRAWMNHDKRYNYRAKS